MYGRLNEYERIAPLILRLAVGLTFMISGWGKISGGVDRVAGFFASLGIPLPGVMAPFISYLEFIGGIALILGVLTQLFSLLFIGDMLVAIALAKLPAALQAATIAESWTEVRTELLLLAGSAALVILGAGVLSVDEALFRRRYQRMEEPAPVAR